MGYIWKINSLNLVLLIIVMQVISCSPKELKISSIELCENFSNEGSCLEKLEKEHTYSISVKRKRFETWEEFSNYIYFHSRQTPGFLVRFNRKFTLKEKELLINSYKARYEFLESAGKVEGFEIGENWVGSFQYLGSIVKDRQRMIRAERNFPYMESVFPSIIKFYFDSPIAKGEITTKINVKLEYLE